MISLLSLLWEWLTRLWSWWLYEPEEEVDDTLAGFYGD